MPHSGVVQAKYCPPPPFLLGKKERETVAQAQGRRYEARALAFLEQWAKGNRYLAKNKPWISYDGVDNKTHYCQPDMVLLSLDSDNLIIIECKLRHCREAFSQLRKYKDMMNLLHPEFVVSLIELCKNFDPAEYPVEVLQEVRPHNLPFATVIWDPREQECLSLN